MKSRISSTRKRTSHHPSDLQPIVLISLVALCVWAALASGAPSRVDDQELKNTRHCKTLCKQCGGLGFYCGEECICECNDDRADTECIANVQRDARQLQLPFEILIQGPGKSRFLRNAFHFEQSARRNRSDVELPVRNKRSTVVIYKPSSGQNSLSDQYEQQQQQQLAAAAPGAVSKTDTKSVQKRSVNQFEWFNDFTNTLVRPAPLRVQRKNDESDESSGEQRRPAKLNPSWFTDNAKVLLQPSPNFRRNSHDQEENQEQPDDAVDTVNLRQQLKDTMRSIQNTGIDDDFGKALRSKILEGTEALQSQLQSKSFHRFLREALSETLKNLRPNILQVDNELGDAPSPASTESPLTASKTRPKFGLFPWFRPMRFLDRVQDAIN